MATDRPPYPPEFRAEAVQLVHASGRSQRAIVAELGLAPKVCVNDSNTLISMPVCATTA